MKLDDDEVTFCTACSGIDFESLITDVNAQIESKPLKRTSSTSDGVFMMNFKNRLSENSPCARCLFSWAMGIVLKVSVDMNYEHTIALPAMILSNASIGQVRLRRSGKGCKVLF